MIRRPPRSTLSSSSAASDVYKRQVENTEAMRQLLTDQDMLEHEAVMADGQSSTKLANDTQNRGNARSKLQAENEMLRACLKSGSFASFLDKSVTAQAKAEL
eukprot:TRINITY_DN1036_c0_g1_i6.p1 TRINITY_DN1036_c0_g1~~TRINITY_DN1036_c0_g1_i6.p1  ORF type:complete len:102 (+),score=23.10 TRINITY_DN1036_c0_g1_i6:66-371(+)